MAEPGRVVRVVSVKRTCWGYPSQWEGRTDDDRPVYAHYRSGSLTVEVGAAGAGPYGTWADGELVVDMAVGGEYDGAMDVSELRQHTAGVVEWPGG